MRKIRLLDEAYLDLQAGHLFYEKQAPGLGGYFLDSLISDIDSLAVYAGIHPTCFGTYYSYFQNGCLLPFTIAFSLKRCWYMRCWIAEESLYG